MYSDPLLFYADSMHSNAMDVARLVRYGIVYFLDDSISNQFENRLKDGVGLHVCTSILHQSKTLSCCGWMHYIHMIFI